MKAYDVSFKQIKKGRDGRNVGRSHDVEYRSATVIADTPGNAADIADAYARKRWKGFELEEVRLQNDIVIREQDI